MENPILFHFILSVFYLFVLNLSQQMVSSESISDLTDNQSTGPSYFFYQQPEYPRDCQEIQNHCSASNASGVHLIKPDGYPKPFEVFCDNSDVSGGWTVIQRRTDGSIKFKRTWTEYFNGFGFPSSEFWLGNEKISFLTNQKTYELQINMVNSFGSSFYVNYNLFRISDDWGNYKLANLGEFSGNAANFIDFCPINMVYDNCACQKTCSDPVGCYKNCIDGEEACICPDGYILDGDTNCVSENDCNCFVNEYSGVIPDGGSYVNSDCSRRCSCNNNQLNCEKFQCSTDATCQEIEGSHQCQCNVGFEGDGLLCSRPTTAPPAAMTDCLDLYNGGNTADGVYTIYPTGWAESGFQVYCDMTTDGGGWTVFQRRSDGSVSFYRSWSLYKSGFGGHSGEHWLGNDKIHGITQQKDYKLRVDLVNSGGSSYHALYTRFRIGNENDKYRLVNLGSYSGTAGGNSMSLNVDEPFSTHDRDNDASSSYNCAQKHRGGWWHYTDAVSYSRCYNWRDGSLSRRCTGSNLNGDYSGGNGENIFWRRLPGSDCNIRKTEMKIRPI